MQQISELERVIGEFQGGRAELGEVVNCFLGTTVVMPSVTDPSGAEGIQPVLFSNDDAPHVVVAVSEEGLNRTNEHAGYGFSLTGQNVVLGLASGTGVLVNMTSGGFTLPPDLIESVRRYLADLQNAASQNTDPQGGGRS